MSIFLLFFDQLKELPKFDRMLTKNIKSIQYVLSKNNGEDFFYKDNVYFTHYSVALQVFQDYPINGIGLKKPGKLKFCKAVYRILRNGEEGRSLDVKK